MAFLAASMSTDESFVAQRLAFSMVQQVYGCRAEHEIGASFDCAFNAAAAFSLTFMPTVKFSVAWHSATRWIVQGSVLLVAGNFEFMAARRHPDQNFGGAVLRILTEFLCSVATKPVLMIVLTSRDSYLDNLSAEHRGRIHRPKTPRTSPVRERQMCTYSWHGMFV